MNHNTDNDDRDPQTYAIIGAAMEVHSRLRHGFLEAVYSEALTIEFGERGVPFREKSRFRSSIGNARSPAATGPTSFCYADVIVELKAMKQVTDVERAQVINYLKATGLQRALLLNFGAPSLEHKRFVRQPTNLRNL